MGLFMPVKIKIKSPKGKAKRKAGKGIKRPAKRKIKVRRPKSPKSAKLKREKRIMRKMERAAKKRGFSLFTWIRRGMHPHHAKAAHLKNIHAPHELAKVGQLKKSDLPKGSVIISAPNLHSLAPSRAQETKTVENGISLNDAPAFGMQQGDKLSETQLKNPVLSTDFDAVLRLIETEGSIGAAEVRSRLKIDGKSLRECYIALEKAGKIRVEYPLFGPPKLVSIDYEKAKKRLALIRRGIRPEDEEDEN